MLASKLTSNMLGVAGAGVIGGYAASELSASTQEQTGMVLPDSTNPVTGIAEGISAGFRGLMVGVSNPFPGQGGMPGFGESAMAGGYGLAAGAGAIVGAGYTAYAMHDELIQAYKKDYVPKGEVSDDVMKRRRRKAQRKAYSKTFRNFNMRDAYSNSQIAEHQLKASETDSLDRLEGKELRTMRKFYRIAYDTIEQGEVEPDSHVDAAKEKRKAAAKQAAEEAAEEVNPRRKLGFFGGGLNKAAKVAMYGSAPMAAGVALGSALPAVFHEGVTEVANQMKAIGTPKSRLADRNMIGSRKRVRQSQPTSGVSRYAGNMRNVVDGSMVLSLHKTGGRGAVLR